MSRNEVPYYLDKPNVSYVNFALAESDTLKSTEVLPGVCAKSSQKLTIQAYLNEIKTTDNTPLMTPQMLSKPAAAELLYHTAELDPLSETEGVFLPVFDLLT